MSIASLRAASITFVPGATSTLRPSMVSSAMDGGPLSDPALEVSLEVDERGAERTGERLGEDADRALLAAAHDVVQEREVLGAPRAALEAGDDLVRPRGSLAAGRTLPAGLVTEEAREHAQRVDQLDLLGDHDDAAGA